MPQHQIQAMLAQYQASRMGHRDPMYRSWSSVPTTPGSSAQSSPVIMDFDREAPSPGLNFNQRRFRQHEARDTSQNRNRRPAPVTLGGNGDPKKSRNPFVNGTSTFSLARDGRLCVKYGELGNVPKDCSSDPLLPWEQQHLRDIVFSHAPP